jgi:hypothetical protein
MTKSTPSGAAPQACGSGPAGGVVRRDAGAPPLRPPTRASSAAATAPTPRPAAGARSVSASKTQPQLAPSPAAKSGDRLSASPPATLGRMRTAQGRGRSKRQPGAPLRHLARSCSPPPSWRAAPPPWRSPPSTRAPPSCASPTRCADNFYRVRTLVLKSTKIIFTKYAAAPSEGLADGPEAVRGGIPPF